MTTESFLPYEDAEALHKTAESTPDDVATETLTALLVRGTPDARQEAGQAYDKVTAARSDAAEEVANEFKIMLASDDPDLQRRTAAAVGDLVDRHPSAYRRTIPVLVDIVDSAGSTADNHVLNALAELARYHPEEIQSAVSALLTVILSQMPREEDAVQGPSHPDSMDQSSPIDQESGDTSRVAAARTLALVANECPETVVDMVDQVELLLSDPDAGVRGAACEVVGAVARTRPDTVHHLLDGLATLLLEDPQYSVVWRAATALAALAGEHPRDLADAIAQDPTGVTILLVDTDTDVRRIGVGLLSYMAEYHPEVVDPVLNDLRDCLADDDPGVRANAARALGDAGKTVSLGPLAELAENDPDQEVQEIAATAVRTIQQHDNTTDTSGENT